MDPTGSYTTSWDVNSSRRFDTVDEYLAGVEPTGAGTVRAIFATIVDARPELRPVIAWNQPMLRRNDDYVFGVSVQSRHILLGPWGDRALDAARPLLEGYTVNKKTVQVPLDRAVDRAIMLTTVESCLDGVLVGDLPRGRDVPVQRPRPVDAHRDAVEDLRNGRGVGRFRLSDTGRP